MSILTILAVISAEILSCNVSFNADSRTSGTLEVKKTIRVYDNKGDRMAGINIRTDEFRSLAAFKGRVVSGNGEEKKISKKDLFSCPEQEFIGPKCYNNVFSPSAALPYTVTYEYTVKYGNGFIAYPEFVAADSYGVAVDEASYTLSLPKGTELEVWTNIEGTSDKSGKTDIYRWEVSGFKPLDRSFLQPEMEDILPFVFAAPKDFKYGKFQGSQADWKSLAECINAMNSGLKGASGDLAAKVRALTDPIPDKLGKIRAVYGFLRENTRYVNIVMGIGGYRPTAPAVVEKTGFGDCKALSMFMKEMLSFAGIDSWYTILNTERGNIPDNMVSAGMMNHAVLCVPLEKDTLWVECTNPSYPLGFTHSGINGHKVLVISDSPKGLVRASGDSVSVRMEKNSLHLELQKDSRTVIRGEVEATGDFIEPFINFTDRPVERQREVISNLFRIQTDKGKVLSLADNFSSWDDLRACPWIKLSYETYGQVQLGAGRARMIVPSNPFDKELPVSKGERTYDFVSDDEYVLSDVITYVIPEGYAVETVPDAVDVRCMLASFSARVEFDGDRTVTVRHDLNVNKGRWDKSLAGEYDAFAKIVNGAYLSRICLVENK